jgi:hypothetical protein
MENLLCEVGLAKLDKIRKLNSTKSAIRILTTTDHSIRPYFMNPNRLSAFGPRTSSEHYRTKTARTIDEEYGKHVKIYIRTDRRWEVK